MTVSKAINYPFYYRLDSEFYDHDFFTEMRENHIQPNEETYKVQIGFYNLYKKNLIRLLCFLIIVVEYLS